MMLGDEKSSISLLRMIPVLVMSLDPKYVLTVLDNQQIMGIGVNNFRTYVVTATASPSGERTLIWEVPESSKPE